MTTPTTRPRERERLTEVLPPVRIGDALLERVLKRAETDGTYVSDVVRAALDAYL